MVYGLLARVAVRAGATAIRSAARQRRREELEERLRQQQVVVVSTQGAPPPVSSSPYHAPPSAWPAHQGPVQTYRDREESAEYAGDERDTRLRGGRLCAVVTCQALLYVMAALLFIASMVAFAIASGSHDSEYFGYEYSHCSWSPNYNSYNENDEFFSGDCRDGQRLWEEWQQQKLNIKVAAIVMLVLAGACLFTAGALTRFLCVKNLRKTDDGLVHQEYLPAMTSVPHTVVTTTVPARQVISPVMQPVPPPDYQGAAKPPYTHVHAPATCAPQMAPYTHVHASTTRAPQMAPYTHVHAPATCAPQMAPYTHVNAPATCAPQMAPPAMLPPKHSSMV